MGHISDRVFVAPKDIGGILLVDMRPYGCFIFFSASAPIWEPLRLKYFCHCNALLEFWPSKFFFIFLPFLAFFIFVDVPRLADNLEDSLKMLGEDKVINEALGYEFIEWYFIHAIDINFCFHIRLFG